MVGYGGHPLKTLGVGSVGRGGSAWCERRSAMGCRAVACAAAQQARALLGTGGGACRWAAGAAGLDELPAQQVSRREGERYRWRLARRNRAVRVKIAE